MTLPNEEVTEQSEAAAYTDGSFDYGDGYAGTEAKEAGDFPVLPRSKRKVIGKNADGSKIYSYEPRYLCELVKPAYREVPNFPGATERLKFQFRSVNFIPGTRARGTVFFEIRKFQTPEQAALSIDADIAAGVAYTRKPGFERNLAIEKRLSYQQRQKATIESLRACLGGQDPLVLMNSGLVGGKFALAVDNQEGSDGQINANAVKFFPASEANA